MQNPRPVRICATFVLLTLIWGSTWATIRIGLRGIPPFTGVALRFAIASVLLLILSPLLKVRYFRSRREPWLWLVNGLLGFSIPYGVVYWCEQWVPSGLASILFATFPLFVALMAHFSLPGERLNPGRLLGVLIGFVGVATIFSEDFSLLGGAQVGFAAAVMLLSPLSSAVSNICIKKWGEGIHPVSLNVVPMGITAGVMGVLAVATEREAPIIFDATSLTALLYLAVFGSAVTFSFYFWLLQHIPATRLSLLAYSIPVVAVAVGAVFLAEPITPRTLGGSLLVVFGVAVAVQLGARRPVPFQEPGPG